MVPAAVGLEMSGQAPRTRSLGERAELELCGRDAEPGGGRCHQAEGSVAFLELASWTREGEALNGRAPSPVGGEGEPSLVRAAAVGEV